MKTIIYECKINPYHHDNLVSDKIDVEQKKPIDYIDKRFKNTGTGKMRNKMTHLKSKNKKR